MADWFSPADVESPTLETVEFHSLKTHKNIPVIIQTAYAYEENRDLAKKAGCTDFIEKPIHADVLMEAVEKSLSTQINKN